MNSHQVVMVEDNEDHALLIKRALEETDLEITHFQNGKLFLGFLESETQSDSLPGMILLDLKLPDYDGLDLLKKVRSINRFQFVPVVILTTSKRPEEVRRAYESGAQGFVAKSEDFGELKIQLKTIKDYWLRTVEHPTARNT